VKAARQQGKTELTICGGFFVGHGEELPEEIRIYHVT